MSYKNPYVLVAIGRRLSVKPPKSSSKRSALRSSSASFYRTKHNDRVFVPNFPLVDLPAVLFVNRRGCSEAIDIQALDVSPSSDGCRLPEHGRSDATMAHLRLNKHRGYPW